MKSSHPRIGEILVEAGLVSAQERERALKSQAINGGRIGTNLIEQNAIGLDPMADGLAQQHDMAPALDRHFAASDPDVQARVPAEVAARWRAVPLGRLPGDTERVAVAVMDPLGEDAIAELSAALGAEVVAAVAPELRILYHLERVYGIPRANRFKRGARRAEGPIRERRGFVATLSDSETLESPSSLARISVRRVEVTRSGEVESPADLSVLDSALVAVRRASVRSRVGELLAGALEQGFDRALSCGMILTIRSGLLLGWKGFVRGRDAAIIEAVAVPLGSPSLFAGPCGSGVSYVGTPPGGGTEIDRKLWRSLGVAAPAEIGVQPVPVFEEEGCVIYVQSSVALPAATAAGLTDLGDALRAALQRMVRSNQR